MQFAKPRSRGSRERNGRTCDTSKTLEARSAAFRVRFFFFFIDFFLIFLLICFSILGLNCCTISCNNSF